MLLKFISWLTTEEGPWDTRVKKLRRSEMMIVGNMHLRDSYSVCLIERLRSRKS